MLDEYLHKYLNKGLKKINLTINIERTLTYEVVIMFKHLTSLVLFVILLSNSAVFSSPESDLQEALSDDPECYAIARKAISMETIVREEPFDWKRLSINFNFEDDNSKRRAEGLKNALESYFKVEIDEVFQKKRGMTSELPEYHIVQDHYNLLVNYSNSISSLYDAACSATFCGEEYYTETLNQFLK